jgi:hypothetical protein
MQPAAGAMMVKRERESRYNTVERKREGDLALKPT